MCLFLAMLISCATIKITTIPEPPPTAKLRVYVVSFTFGGKVQNRTSDDKFHEKQLENIEQLLDKTGIYEVVNANEIRAVIGDQGLSYNSMKKSEWVEARQIGKALHADFIFIVTRDQQRLSTGEWSFITTTELLNVETDKAYRSHKTLDGNNWSDETFKAKSRLVLENHKDLFNQASQDMLSVAIRKGRLLAAPTALAIRDYTEVTRAVPPMTPQKEDLSLVTIRSEPPKPDTTPIQPPELPQVYRVLSASLP